MELNRLNEKLDEELNESAADVVATTAISLAGVFSLAAVYVWLSIIYGEPVTAVIDSIVDKIKQRRINFQTIESLSNEMKSLGVDVKELTNKVRVADFTQKVQKLFTAKNREQAERAEKELKLFLRESEPWKNRKIREAINKIKKENRARLIDKIKSLFNK